MSALVVVLYVQICRLLFYRKICPGGCIDRSVSFGEKINYYMHKIHFNNNTNLEAIKFIEPTFCGFFFTAFIPSPCAAGCWQLSSTVHCEACGCSQAKGQPWQWGQLFSQNQHLFYLTMIWFGLHGNCSGFFFFFPDVESTGGGAAHHV